MHPNQPFDPTMVVSLSTAHATDWGWQAVQSQMEQLRIDGYITRTKLDGNGTTYWTITLSGKQYLKALMKFEDDQAIARSIPQIGDEIRASVGATFGRWQELRPLGEGGQSRVILVRRLARVEERKQLVQEVLRSNPWAPYVGGNSEEISDRVDHLAASLAQYARPELPSDLGALKLFKISQDSTETEAARGRLRNEITVLRQGRPGLVKLIDANEDEKWIVTEFMPRGTLFELPTLYVGNLAGALKAFRSLVATVADLHKDGYIHRDIKPANVFIGDDGRLVLGDFGIVFVPDGGDRLTMTDERVGPRDYIPQWGDLGERLENVHTNFDVYMLGKLLWCMSTGRLKLPREYYRRPAYDVRSLLQGDPKSYIVDEILGKCVVEEPEQCLASAVELLAYLDDYLDMLERGGQILGEGVPRPCHVCGKGQYKRLELDRGVAGEPVIQLSLAGKPITASVFVCDNPICGHVELFHST